MNMMTKYLSGICLFICFQQSQETSVELRIEYHPDQFSVDVKRPEVQSEGNVSNFELRFLNCILPSLCSGWVTFGGIKNALQPLLSRGTIRGIEQKRAILQKQGIEADSEVAFVTHPDDADDKTGDSGYASLNGHYYSSEEFWDRNTIAITAPDDEEMEQHLEKKVNIHKVVKGGEVLIVVGQRRTVLRLYDLHSGVELHILYHPEQFSVDVNRLEMQRKGTASNSHLEFLNCIVPGLPSGPVPFTLIKKVLQPLFLEGNVRGIEQKCGRKNRRTVVSVAHPDDANDETEDSGYGNPSGHHYSSDEVEEKKIMAITASENDEMEKQLRKKAKIDEVNKRREVTIAGGIRRTELKVHDLISGVELYVAYHHNQFTVSVTRFEVQHWGNTSNSDFEYLSCIVPGLQAGWATFQVIRDALQPLFQVGKIRAIEQLQRKKDGTTAVLVIEDNTGNPGFTSADGRNCSDWRSKKSIAITDTEDREMKGNLKKKAKVSDVIRGGDVLIVTGGRRTVLRLYDFPVPDSHVKISEVMRR